MTSVSYARIGGRVGCSTASLPHWRIAFRRETDGERGLLPKFISQLARYRIHDYQDTKKKWQMTCGRPETDT